VKGESAKPATSNPQPETRPSVTRIDQTPGKEEASDAEKTTEPTAPESAEKAGAEAALSQLREGNLRWSRGDATSPNTDRERMQAVAADGQTPFATIITCSDSRVPIERVFDRGVGDLFVVRVAGNRAGASEAGTVEYGLEHLKTPLLVVMGHTKCGAVAAAASHAPLHGRIADLVAGIQPAVERARRLNPNADEVQLAALAVRENVWQTVFDLYKSSTTVRELVDKGEVKVVGAVYDIATGKVEFLGEHPWQKELISAMGSAAPETTKTATVPEHE
jgi:carbonic anhydrase